MATRLELQSLLESLFPDAQVYYQPPSDISISYPAVVYNLDYADLDHADNIPWYVSKRYQVTAIDSDPDSPITDKLLQLPSIKYVRHFTTEGLNHNIFDLYF